jgi:hypothetical protein
MGRLCKGFTLILARGKKELAKQQYNAYNKMAATKRVSAIRQRSPDNDLDALKDRLQPDLEDKL